MGKLPSDLSSVTTVGLDLAKHVFFVHAVDAQGQVVFAKEVRRRDLLSLFASLPACLVGVEACSSAHHWARELMGLGHDVRLMPPVYVKPYVKRQKNDAADDAAICEAVTRPSMRFVKVRSIDNQAVVMYHKVREMLVRQRTQILNGLRGHLAEIGIIAAQSPVHARALADLLRQGDASIPEAVAKALLPLVTQLKQLDAEIKESDSAIVRLARPIRWRVRCCRSRASAQSRPRRWLPAWLIHPASRVRSSSPRSLAWCHDRTRRVASPGSGVSQRWATPISGSCWSWARTLCSIIARGMLIPSAAGRKS